MLFLWGGFGADNLFSRFERMHSFEYSTVFKTIFNLDSDSLLSFLQVELAERQALGRGKEVDELNCDFLCLKSAVAQA